MKQVHASLAILVHLGLLIVTPCHSATLRALEQRQLGGLSDVRYAVLAGRNSIVVISDSGLYVQGSTHQEWRKLIDCAAVAEQIPFSTCDGDTLFRLISPSGMWLDSTTGGNQLFIFDQFCGRLFRLTRASDESFYLTKCDQRRGGDLFDEVNVQDGTIICVLWGNDTKKKIVIQHVNGGEYRKLFRCSDKLMHLRDSVGLYNMTLGIPAIDPKDSTLWLAIEGYPYIYITGMDGELRDSVPILNTDYRRPQPERSRMKSDAVVDEWFSHWTPITSFAYVSPCYFIMQYKTGSQQCKNLTLEKFSTVVWDTKRQVIPLIIDPLWRLAGVQPDGRLIFVDHTSDSTGREESLVVGRIEP